jgi:hypothetical protein
VPRNWLCIFILIGLVFFAAGAWSDAARAAEPERLRAENLLPDTTVGALAVTNFDHLRTQWDKTQVGHLMNDPVMASFKKDMQKQLEHRFGNLEKRLSLTLDDVKDLPSGELCVALIRPAPAQAAVAVIVDCAGHLEEANAVLQKVSNSLTKQGAKKSQQTVEGIKVTRFDIPKIEEADAPKRIEEPPAKDAGASGKKTAGSTTKPKSEPPVEYEHAAYFLEGNLLVAADDFAVIDAIIGRLKGKQSSALAGVTGFQEVMKRCQQDMGAGEPQIRWFLHPVGYAEAARASLPEEERRPGKSVLEILQNQGFSAIQGVGGYIDLCPKDGYELIHRTAVHAPPPYEKSMKMLVFPNGADYAPQPWVPRDIASYATFYVDILNAFDNFGPLFGELFGDTEPICSVDLVYQKDLDAGKVSDKFSEAVEKATKSQKVKISTNSVVTVQAPGNIWSIIDNANKEKYVVKKGERKVIDKTSKQITKVTLLRVSREMTGLWEETLEGLRLQDRGPKINLRPEFFVHLGQRVTVITDYELPITTTSERLFFAVEIKDEKAVAAAVEKLMTSDPPPKRTEEYGCVIWETTSAEETDAIAPPVVAMPSLNVRNEDAKTEAPQEKAPRLLPHLTVTVADGHLFAASHRDFLIKVLETRKANDPRNWLGRSTDFQSVAAEAEKSAVKQKCAYVFSRLDEALRPTYELIRQGKMPEAETILARVINTFSPEAKKNEMRQQKIDGKNLPDFDVVRHYLGQAGFTGTSEPNGWFFRGFTLTKESE